MIRILAAAIAFALILTGAACTSSAPSEEDVLVSLIDEVIVPRYEEVASRLADLDDAIRTLCDAPTEAALEDVRADWRAVRVPLMRSEAMWFGPMMDRRALGLVDWSEVEPERIEALLAGGGHVDATLVREGLAATQRGLGAIEYLIFAPGALLELSEPDFERCNFLVAIGQVARTEMDAVLSEWEVSRSGGREPFKDFFTGRSDNSMLTSAAVAEVVRIQVFLARSLADMRLATALALRGGEPDPSAARDGPGGAGLSDLENELLGMRDIYVGSEGGLGISDLIVPLSEEIDTSVRERFIAALAAVRAVEGPLAEAVTERPEQVKEAYDRLAEVRMVLATDVVSLLGVSVGFSDTDGDSLR